MGLERIAINLKEQKLAPEPGSGPRVVVVTLGDGTTEVGAKLAASLRRAGVSATMTYGGRSMKAQMRHANRVGAGLALIVGERELAEGVVEVRDLAASEQRRVLLADVVTELTSG